MPRALKSIPARTDLFIPFRRQKAHKALRSGKVVEILKDWALPLTNLSAVYPAGRLASTKARAFVSFVERYMGAMNSVSPAHVAASVEGVEQAAEQDTLRGRRTASADDGLVHRGARSSAEVVYEHERG
jgi:hypothetical protein